MPKQWTSVFLGFFLMSLTSCVSLFDYQPDLPVHDKVLTYDLPYDYVYLRTLEAVNTMSNWMIEQTDKEGGFIALRNTQYGHLFDLDKQTLEFEVRRLARKQTSVRIAPSFQKVKEGGEFLDRIENFISQRAASRLQQEAPEIAAAS
jgi:hypothetical protein